MVKDALKIEHTGWAIALEESLRPKAGIPLEPEDWLILRLESLSSHSSARMMEKWNGWAHCAGGSWVENDDAVLLADAETK